MPPADPTVSIVTVCLNAEPHIAGAIESVIGQSLPVDQYVIVDGGSTDGTLEVIERYRESLLGRLTVVSEPDDGLYDAMNKGVALASGDLIGIVNADDRLMPEAVELVVETWCAAPDAGVIHGADRTVSSTGETRVRTTPEKVTLAAMLRDHIVHHHAAFVSADTYRRVGRYSTSHPIAADYDFFLRCLEHGVRFVRVDAVLTEFSLGGVSHENVRATDRDATRVRIEHGVNPLFAWGRFAKRAAAFWLYNRLKHLDWFERAYRAYRDGRAE